MRCDTVSVVDRADEDLKELESLLRESPMTARAIAERLGISKPTAYARVAKLAMRGVVVQRTKVREGLHGPEADAFSVAEKSEPKPEPEPEEKAA